MRGMTDRERAQALWDREMGGTTETFLAAVVAEFDAVRTDERRRCRKIVYDNIVSHGGRKVYCSDCDHEWPHHGLESHGWSCTLHERLWSGEGGLGRTVNGKIDPPSGDALGEPVPVCVECGEPGDPFSCPKHPGAVVAVPDELSASHLIARGFVSGLVAVGAMHESDAKNCTKGLASLLNYFACGEDASAKAAVDALPADEPVVPWESPNFVPASAEALKERGYERVNGWRQPERAHENEACALLVDTLLGNGNHVAARIRSRMFVADQGYRQEAKEKTQ
ncbi:hypothetical protein AKJ09_03696 [Labilithrix luteola]|uniref:Uncharacterized protein n=1 Tax=Labilithrix luteola TaxID=1391654 RepID=A0A0K1PU37_9BACT|nr:hypothetical protein [Labilithrix luteola]AKU97032.1 hypothetical protein AKJ09_03696 [Labilithrix luteola]